MEIVLQPFKLKGKRLVPASKEFIKLQWSSYKQLLSVTESRNSLFLLSRVRAGYYVGLREENGNPVTFIYYPEQSSFDASALVNKNPKLESQITKLYKVIKTDFGYSTRI